MKIAIKKAVAAIFSCAALAMTLCACGSKAPNTPELSEPPAEDRRTNPIAENKFETIDVEGGVKITGCTGNSPEVIIPETINGKTVVSIRDMSFDVENIEKLYIPAGVVKINDFMGAFYIYSDSFAEIEVAEGNTAFYSRDGVLYNKDNELLCYPRGKTDESFAIPDGTTAIGEYAFNNARSLKSVTIPESVTELKKGAFNNCESLNSANIPKAVTSLPAYAFGGCGRLEDFEIPEGLVDINGYAFHDSEWAELNADESGLVIVNGTLVDASSASGDVVIPKTVKRISELAFDDCDELKSVKIPDGLGVDVEEMFDDEVKIIYY